MRTNILIEMRGGNIVDVYCDELDVEITILDWDKAESPNKTDDYIQKGNFEPSYLDEMVLEEKLNEVNNVIQKNIDYDVEQRK